MGFRYTVVCFRSHLIVITWDNLNLYLFVFNATTWIVLLPLIGFGGTSDRQHVHCRAADASEIELHFTQLRVPPRPRED